jgi:hypothetical protein
VRTGFNSKAINLETYSEILHKSHASIADHGQKDRAQFSVNARECIRCERERRHNQNIIRIVRLKSDRCGALRTAGPLIEFAERHLPDVIAILRTLQAGEAA